MSEENKKILIIEDNPEIIKAVAFALEEAGYQVEMAGNGDEGLAKIKEDGYDLALLDLVMPGKTGFELMHELKMQGHKIPIIVYSNMPQEDTKEEALNMGAIDYFAKVETSLDEVIEIIKKHVEG